MLVSSMLLIDDCQSLKGYDKDWVAIDDERWEEFSIRVQDRDSSGLLSWTLATASS
jgi:hypothetical protein